MNGGIVPPPLPRRDKYLFSRRLSHTSISKRLPVPPQILADFPDFRGSHAVKLQVRFETNTYPMMCSVRKSGSYKKPVLSKGWIEFVRRNRLKVGDEVTLFKLEQDGTESAGAIYLIEVERAVTVSSSMHQDGPSLPHFAQDDSTVAACGKSPPVLRGSQIKLEGKLKLFAPFNTTKDVEETKPFGPPATQADATSRPTNGPNISQFRASYGDQAKGRSPDYDTEDRDEIKQLGLGVGGPSKWAPVKLYDKTNGRTLEFMSSTKEDKKIDESIGKLAFELNYVHATGGGGVLDLSLKLGI